MIQKGFLTLSSVRTIGDETTPEFSCILKTSMIVLATGEGESDREMLPSNQSLCVRSLFGRNVYMCRFLEWRGC